MVEQRNRRFRVNQVDWSLIAFKIRKGRQHAHLHRLQGKGTMCKGNLFEFYVNGIRVTVLPKVELQDRNRTTAVRRTMHTSQPGRTPACN